MRPIKKSIKVDEQNNPVTYIPWGKAKQDLINEIGCYCSYCGRGVPSYNAALAVEHILAKSLPKYAHLIYRWDNFLLCCINCNSIKKNKDFDLAETYLPHLNNLLFTIEISEGGFLKIKDELTEDQKRRTKNFIELVGLDRAIPDDRYKARLRVWDMSLKKCKEYEKKEINLQAIIDIAMAYGFWSVWMKVFNRYPEVKKELINQFPGTAISCFDVDYNPLPRNGNNP